MFKVLRVVVLCPNARRETVDLTPNSSILQILEESCKKQNLNPNDFDIYHYNKSLDLTLPVRFANLANNAQLELKPAKSIRKDSLVTIGLQLESGERIMKDFVPSVSVSDVVEQCLSIKLEENCDKKGECVCIYMRQKLIGDELKNTTLRSLGLTKGSAIIRLMYRNPDDISDQAHISTHLSNPPSRATNVVANNKPFDENTIVYKKSSDSTSNVECSLATQSSKVQPVPKDNLALSGKTSIDTKSYNQDLHEKISSLDTLEEKCELVVEKKFNAFFGKGIALGANKPSDGISEDQQIKMDDSTSFDESTASEENIRAIHYIGKRHAVLYSLDDITDVKKADLPEEFFELTIDDVKYLMEEYKKSRVDMENKPLLTKELRDRQVLRALGRYKQTVIRIYFPERMVLQAVFEATETVQNVCEFVKEYLEDKSLNFYLYTTPPKEKKDPAKSLIESMLIPAAVVYFGSEKQLPSYLDNSLRQKISDPRAATLAAYESMHQAISNESEAMMGDPVEFPNLPSDMIVEMSNVQVPGPSTLQLPQSTGKIPKWLKLGKK